MTATSFAFSILLTVYITVHIQLTVFALLLDADAITLPYDISQWIKLEVQSHRGLPWHFGELAESKKLVPETPSQLIRVGLVCSDLLVQVPAAFWLPYVGLTRNAQAVIPASSFALFSLAQIPIFAKALKAQPLLACASIAWSVLPVALVMRCAPPDAWYLPRRWRLQKQAVTFSMVSRATPPRRRSPEAPTPTSAGPHRASIRASSNPCRVGASTSSSVSERASMRRGYLSRTGVTLLPG